MKPTQAQINAVLADPVVQAYNPANGDYVDVRWHAKHRFADYGFEMGAVLLFGKNKPHVKAPVAFQLLYDAYVAGELDGILELIEASSGNTGHGLARLGRKFGVRKVTLVLPGDVAVQKREVLSALGANTLQHNDPNETTIEAAERMAHERPGRKHLNQYLRDSNWRVHLLHTAPQIHRIAGLVDLVGVPVGSGGQWKGVSDFYAANNPATEVLGVFCAPNTKEKKNNNTPGARTIAASEATGSGWLKTLHPRHRIEVDRHNSFVTMRRIWDEMDPQVGPTSGMTRYGLEDYLDRMVDEHGTGWLKGKKGLYFCDDDGRMYAERGTGEMDADELFSDGGANI